MGDKEDLFNIIFDTGSSLTFINSVNCDDNGCSRGTQYDSNDSDTHEYRFISNYTKNIQKISYEISEIF